MSDFTVDADATRRANPLRSVARQTLTHTKMKTHTPPTSFHSLRVEKRLALGLLAQPQNKNRRRQQPDNGSDTWLTLMALLTLLMFFIPLILFLTK